MWCSRKQWCAHSPMTLEELLRFFKAVVEQHINSISSKTMILPKSSRWSGGSSTTRWRRKGALVWIHCKWLKKSPYLSSQEERAKSIPLYFLSTSNPSSRHVLILREIFSARSPWQHKTISDWLIPQTSSDWSVGTWVWEWILWSVVPLTNFQNGVFGVQSGKSTIFRATRVSSFQKLVRSRMWIQTIRQVFGNCYIKD